jgi:hypothetical protein
LTDFLSTDSTALQEKSSGTSELVRELA